MKKMLTTLLISAVFLTANAKAENLNERVGVYAWGQLADSSDPLVTAIEDARILGAGKITRKSISPYWDPRGANTGGSQFLPLYQKMHRSDYWEFFNAFSVVMITAYDAASYNARYRLLNRLQPQGFSAQGSKQNETAGAALTLTQAEPRGYRLLTLMNNGEAQTLLDDAYSEFQRFAFNLACEIPNGTFIISNWEAENDVGSHNEEGWKRYVAYIQARLDGITAGRTDALNAGCRGKVYSTFEFANIKALGGGWDVDTYRPSGITFAPQLRGLDFLSYSAWSSIGYNYQIKHIRLSFQEAIRNIKLFAHENGITERLVIGEFGELWDLWPTAERTQAMIDTALSEGVEYMFNWVLYDQPGSGVWQDGVWYDQSHFGKLFQDRTLTPQGAAFQNSLVSGVLLYGSPCEIGESENSCTTTIYYRIPDDGRTYYAWTNHEEPWVHATVSGGGEFPITLRRNETSYIRILYWDGGEQWSGRNIDVAGVDISPQ